MFHTEKQVKGESAIKLRASTEIQIRIRYGSPALREKQRPNRYFQNCCHKITFNDPFRDVMAKMYIRENCH